MSYIAGGIADLPNILQEAQIDVITPDYCTELWSPTPIGDFHVCLLDLEYQDTSGCMVVYLNMVSALKKQSLVQKLSFITFIVHN